MPILLAVWANLHGGVLAGIGLYGLWATVRIVAGSRDESAGPARRLELAVRLGLIGCVCFLALLLNPYGPGLVSLFCCTATVARPEIGEWAPLSLISLPGPASTSSSSQSASPAWSGAGGVAHPRHWSSSASRRCFP